MMGVTYSVIVLTCLPEMQKKRDEILTMIIRRRTSRLHGREEWILHGEDGVLTVTCRVKGPLKEVDFIFRDDDARIRWTVWDIFESLGRRNSAIGVFWQRG